MSGEKRRVQLGVEGMETRQALAAPGGAIAAIGQQLDNVLIRRGALPTQFTKLQVHLQVVFAQTGAIIGARTCTASFSDARTVVYASPSTNAAYRHASTARSAR